MTSISGWSLRRDDTSNTRPLSDASYNVFPQGLTFTSKDNEGREEGRKEGRKEKESTKEKTSPSEKEEEEFWRGL